MLNLKNSLLICFVIFFLGCGYHLRGSVDLPDTLKNVFVQGASSQLKTDIKQTLRASGGQLVNGRQQAGIVVSIIKEKMKRRVLSLSQTGRANEFEINYRLDFIFLDAAGKPLSEQQRIEINRSYFNNQEEILGKNNEEDVIRKEMYNQAVQAILSRARLSLEQDKN